MDPLGFGSSRPYWQEDAPNKLWLFWGARFTGFSRGFALCTCESPPPQISEVGMASADRELSFTTERIGQHSAACRSLRNYGLPI